MTGSISTGTLRSQDLIPAFLEALSKLSPEAYQQMQEPATGFAMVPAYALEDEESGWWYSVDCDCVMYALEDALNEHAPDGTYFGAHPGDGADFGFWPIDADDR